MNTNALIIIAKYPDGTNVKTRLKDMMEDNERISLYVTLLHQTVQNLRNIPGIDTFIAFAPYDKTEYFSRFGLELIPLAGSELGENMFCAFRTSLSRGYRKVLLAGADIPDLSKSVILDSIDKLSEHDLVFGPAEDGGYYLVGMNKMIREIFENIPWSTEHTLSVSISRAVQKGYTVGLTRMLYDIDTIEDVMRMRLAKHSIPDS